MIVSTVPCAGCGRRVEIQSATSYQSARLEHVTHAALCGLCEALAAAPPAVIACVCCSRPSSLARALFTNH